MSEIRPHNPSRLAAAVAILAAACLLGAAAAGHAGPIITGNIAISGPQQLFPNDNPSRGTSSIAADPLGIFLLAGFEDLQGLCGPPGGLACPPNSPHGLSNFAFSVDAGISWTDGGTIGPIGTASTAGHPWVERLPGPFFGLGPATWFYTSRMEDQATGAANGVGIYRGRFGAGTFNIEDGQIINSANGANDQYGRQAIAAAKDGSQSAYIVLVDVEELCAVPLAGFGEIHAWRTHDAGNSWQGPVIVSPDTAPIKDPTNPNCGNAGYIQIAPAVATGPHGEVYAVWQYGPFFTIAGNTATDSVAFSASFDGGATWSAPALITTINDMRENPPVGYAKNRMNDQSRIAVAADGAHKGRIYVTFPSAASPAVSAVVGQSPVSSQVYSMYSDDRGATWSTPTPLAGPVPPTGLKRFWPTVSVRPGGDVDVIYMESQEVATGSTCTVAVNPVAFRSGPLSSLVDTFFVQSHDGGVTFSAPVKVSTATSDWCTAPYQFASAFPTDGFLVSNAGDYIGSTSVLGRTLALWPDDRDTFMSVFYGSILGFAGH